MFDGFACIRDTWILGRILGCIRNRDVRKCRNRVGYRWFNLAFAKMVLTTACR